MRRLRWIVSVAVIGLAAGCVAPAVAEGPVSPGCQRVSEVVGGFLIEMDPVNTPAPADYQVWWNDYMTERIPRLHADYFAAVKDCPALQP